MTDPVRTFRHFRDVPQTLWRWSNFSPAEIACRGTGQLKLHPAALDKLQALRNRLGKPGRGWGAAIQAHGGHGFRYRHVKP
jgi:zinc D-Ala-D-Ala carboxypeptidase